VVGPKSRHQSFLNPPQERDGEEKSRAERLTGYDIRSVGANSGKIADSAFRDDEPVIVADHVTEDLAPDALVREVDRLNSLEVLKRHGRRCARCRGARRLKSTTDVSDRMAARMRPITWSLCAGVVIR
jgi:hypothetical protein